ncbi:MAG: ATP-binding protein [Deltaproteobacteria bacterium]|nr:ATP-binding protein [Deltaproteobacteria bacterium]
MRIWRQSEIDTITKSLDNDRIVVVSGVRGSGKSTVLKKIADNLTNKEGTGHAVVQIDLEDPRFAPHPETESLELFSRATIDNQPNTKTLVILDEAGLVNGWLDWAKDIRKRAKVGILASVSGPSDVRSDEKQSEVSQHHLYPLSFGQWLAEFTDVSVDNGEERRQLSTYLETGGLPVSWLSEHRRHDLADLFYHTLFRDIILRHEVRGVDKLTAIAVYLVSMTASPISVSQIRGLLSKSVDQARGFLSHLEQSGLIRLVSRVEDQKRKRAQAARLCFAADTGLAVALSSGTIDKQKLAMTATYNELRRMNLGIMAWRAKGKLGLAVAKDSGKTVLIQVEFDSDPVGGLGPLTKAMTEYKCQLGMLLSGNPRVGKKKVRSGIVHEVSVWSWLLNPQIPGIHRLDYPDTEETEIPAKAEQEKTSETKASLPRHLL